MNERLNDRAAWSQPVVRWFRPAGSRPAPLVVFLHGRGADETDLTDLVASFPRGIVYASLRAPVPVEGGGYTWFENRGPARPIAASLRTSVASFRRWLDGPEVGMASARCTLLGFSAGMMMAAAVVLDDPQRFAGAVLLSGAIALDAQPDRAVAGRLKDVPVFYGFGTHDDVIPADLVRRTQTYLSEQSGADLTIASYPHGHEISRRETDDIRAWLAQRA